MFIKLKAFNYYEDCQILIQIHIRIYVCEVIQYATYQRNKNIYS